MAPAPAYSTCLTAQNESESAQIASTLAPLLRSGDVVLLDGVLAAGKTFFIRALLQALGYEDDVTSPTYTIANIYDVATGSILHVDAYRLEDSREFHGLGLEDYIENGISLIEWGSRIAQYFEAPLQISIAIGTDETTRHFTISAQDPRWEKPLALLGDLT